MLTDPNRKKPPIWRIALYCVLTLALLTLLGYLTSPR